MLIEQLQIFLFWVIAIVAVISAGAVILNRSAVYSALSLLVNFITLSVLYVMLNAQFIAAVQVAVYAGAVVVLFLFVEMLLGASGRIRPAPWLTPRLIVVLVAAFVLLTVLGTVVYEGMIGGASGNATPAMIAQVGQAEAVGLTLFTDYLLAVEMAAVLMLVGLVGAIVLAQQPRTSLDNRPRRGPARQRAVVPPLAKTGDDRCLRKGEGEK